MQKTIKKELSIFVQQNKPINEFIEIISKKYSLSIEEVNIFLKSIRLELKRFIPIDTSFVNSYKKKYIHSLEAKKLSKMSKEDYIAYKKSKDLEFSTEYFKNLFKYETPGVAYEEKAKLICNKMRESYKN